MGENGIVNGMESNGFVHNGDSREGGSSHSSKHKHKDKERRKETEEERRIRKEKERKEREERHRREGRREETEEERRIRKEKERRDREERHRREGRRDETEEERRVRKERERKEREERHRREGRKDETEEERRIRKEKERKEREERKRREGRRDETEEERRIRKERERRERDEKRKETEEERRERKERERRERKERERREREEAEAVKEEPQDDDEEQMEDQEYEDNQVKEEPMDESEEEEAPARSSNKKRKAASEDEDESYDPSGGDYSSKKSRASKKVKYEEEDDEEEDYKPVKKEKKATPAKSKAVNKAPAASPQKKGRGKKQEEEQEVWKWWEEKEKRDDGTKWSFLQHKGPLFAPLYERLPKSVKFFYDGEHMKLSEETEEVATFYGRMLDHDYTSKAVFNTNFFKDWRKVMTQQEREVIRSLDLCDFRQINEHFKKVSEERKGRSKEEKKAEKERNEAIQNEYGFCVIDGHKEKIGNFRIEPPGLFRGRGEHPKQGMLKKRVNPEDVIINCSKDSEIPEPPEGRSWKKVQHDNTVTWLASWTENVQNQIKYVMLNPSSKLKGEKDMMKYEKARELKKHIDKIRENYTADFKSKEMRLRQRSVALYFIDKLALRAGNEKDEDQADTVGCCSLRVEHITLHPEMDGKEYVVEFDFLGKDSIRYNNSVPVEKRVFKNVQLFMENKKGSDDLFDRLNTSILNEYLNSLMPGLTAKVFRTYNASFTLQEQLEQLTDEDDNIPSKMLSYNRANRAVAVLCNHQRAVPKTHEKSMENLKAKIDSKQEQVSKCEKDFKNAKKAAKGGGNKAAVDKTKKALERAMEQLNRLETQAVDKEENKTIALGTSKLNYLDPRISVAWCKKYEVPIEKVYNKTQRDKFRWAIEMAGPDYFF